MKNRSIYLVILLFSTVASIASAKNDSPLFCNANKVVHCSADSSCNSVDLNSLSTFDAISLTFSIEKKSVLFKSTGQKEQSIDIKTITTLNNQLRLSGQHQVMDDSETVDYWTAVFTDNNKSVAITVLRNELASIIFAKCSSGKIK